MIGCLWSVFFCFFQTPELEEELFIHLVNASGGATIATSGSVATITVEASDHPYGLFTFSSGFRPLVVEEDEGEVEVTVTREFGDIGRVTVSYMTVESGHSSLQGLVDTTQLQQNRYTPLYSCFSCFYSFHLVCRTTDNHLHIHLLYCRHKKVGGSMRVDEYVVMCSCLYVHQHRVLTVIRNFLYGHCGGVAQSIQNDASS